MGRKIKTIFIQLIMVVIIFELILRVLYFQKNATEPFAFISAYKSISFRASDNYRERLLAYHNRIRPDSIHVNKEIVNEVIESNSFHYSPWVDYKNIDFSGKYVNTNGFVRKSSPDKYINPGKPKTMKVFLFGGSTMFGFNVIDKETIASGLVEVYRQKCSECISIEVYNYGIPAYYSYNELMLLSQLIYAGNKPDVAIFLDGLNDLVIVQAARNKLPWYYFRLKENIKNEKDSTLSLFQLRAGESAAMAAKDVAEKYFTNSNYIHQLCKANDITPMFFIQPNPYFNYTNKVNDPIVDSAANEIVTTGYAIFEKGSDSSKNIFFLGNMLKNEKGLPFIDQFHYSPHMNKRIAEEIYERLAPALNE